MLRTLLPTLVAAALLVGFAVWVYRRRELPVRGRGRLAALRGASIALLVVLIANPSLPARNAAGSSVPWVIVDASRSMGVVADGSDRAPWVGALDRARELGRSGARLLVLGETPRALEGPADLDSLPNAPAGRTSALVPALRQAAEAGARDVTVLTDLRLDDDVALLAETTRLGVAVRFEDFGGSVRSAGIARLGAPAVGRAGARVEIDVEAFATEGAAGDSATLTLLRDGQPEAAWRVLLPAPGAAVRRTYEGALPERAGAVFWQARIQVDGDAFPDDDRRTAVTDVDPASGVVALVAFAPDWEPRFLLPVLAGVTGLPARGWLRVGGDRYLPMEGGPSLSGAELQPILADARVVVLQGRGRGEPDWAEDVAARASRVLVFAGDETGAAATGVAAAPARDGEWYVLAPPPPSPLTGVLAGVAVDDLPPLTRVLPAGESADGTPALVLRGPGGASTTPALMLLDRPDRRVAVALARGFWRWAFRPGAPNEAYRSLWSGVAGWLLALDDGRPHAGLAPEAPVLFADRPVVWRAPTARGGRIELTFMADSGSAEPRVDTVAVSETGQATVAPLPAGRVVWRGRVLEPDSTAEQGRAWQGTVEVEPWTGELLPIRADLAEAGAALENERPDSGLAQGIPLRTRPWPYLLLLALLSLEWFGRRRLGLR